jgi:dTDP-4-amino-4,6-dideoxygalactose transaminase
MIELNSPIKPDLKKLNRHLEGINQRGWFTNFGVLHEELTHKLEEYLKVDNLLLVNNGTTALQIAGKVLGSDNLVCTPFSFAATTAAYRFMGNELAFSDVDRATYNLCPELLERKLDESGSINGVVGTHVYGNPCDVESLERVTADKGVRLIYDAAHAFGVNVGKRSVLSFGDASTLSFHATKVFHTVEGGAVVFKEPSSHELAKQMINFGINPISGELIELGTNGKMSEYHAAVGLVNLEVIDDVLERRLAVFEEYIKQLKDVVEIPSWHNDANHNSAYMPIKLNDRAELVKLQTSLLDNNIQSRNYFSPSLESLYGDAPFCPVSQELAQSVLCLPMHVNVTLSDVNKIVDVVKRTL